MGSCVSMPERRIVLLGRTGDGKSSAVNTILGEKVFTPKTSEKSAEAQCEIKKTRRYGRKSTVIEMPGFFGTDHDDEKTKSEIIRALVECSPGVDAFVIILKVGNYKGQEMKELKQHLKTLKGGVFEHAVILFTFGKELKGRTIEEFVKADSQLQELVDKCGGRCHVIDNKHWKKRKRGYKSNRVQVKKLLDTIDKMVNENGCYTNELFQNLEEQIQHEMKDMDEDNLQPEEKREKAKKNVLNNMLVHFAGVTIVCLLGLLLGIVAKNLPLRVFLNTVSAFVGAGVERKRLTGETATETQNKTEADKSGEKVEAEVKTDENAGTAVIGGAIARFANNFIGATEGAISAWKAVYDVYDAIIKATKFY